MIDEYEIRYKQLEQKLLKDFTDKGEKIKQQLSLLKDKYANKNGKVNKKVWEKYILPMFVEYFWDKEECYLKMKEFELQNHSFYKGEEI